jgi:hypothetical protein
LLAAGKAPLFVAPWIAGAPLVPLIKKDNGVRPIAIGELLRRVVSRAFCTHPQLRERMQKCFLEVNQLGVGVNGGAEAAVQIVKLRIAAAGHSESIVALKVDFKNAYNSISREKIQQGLLQYFPELTPWFNFCYGQGSFLSCQNEVMPFRCERGVQQGDPLGPFFFSLGMRRCCSMLREQLPSSCSIWYLDDGMVIGPEAEVNRAWHILQDEAKLLDLTINISKCEVWTNFTGECAWLPPEVSRCDAAGFELLGCPIGNTEFCSKSIAARIVKIQESLKRLEIIDDPQVEYLLIRSCLGLPKLVFALRNTPPRGIQDAVREFDHTIRDTFCSRFGLDLSNEQLLQTSLPVRFGGLGIVRAEDLLEACFLGSLLSAQQTISVILGRPFPIALFDGAREAFASLSSQVTSPDMPASLEALESTFLIHAGGRPRRNSAHPQQKLTSFIHQRNQLRFCHPRAPSSRQSLHATAVCRPGAGNWLNSLPLEELGMKFAPWEFHTVIRWWLGLPVFPLGVKCPLVSEAGIPCGCDLDIWGDHAVKCPFGATLIARHDGLNLTWFEILRSAGYHPSLEQYTDPHSHRRSADTFVPNWQAGASAAHDWTVTHLMVSRSLRKPDVDLSEVLKAAESRKVSHAQDVCLSRGITFIPLAMDTFCGLGNQASKCIRKLVTDFRLRKGKQPLVTESHLTQRLRCVMLKGLVAQIMVRQNLLEHNSTIVQPSAARVWDHVRDARGGHGSWRPPALPPCSHPTSPPCMPAPSQQAHARCSRQPFSTMPPHTSLNFLNAAELAPVVHSQEQQMSLDPPPDMHLSLNSS